MLQEDSLLGSEDESEREEQEGAFDDDAAANGADLLVDGEKERAMAASIIDRLLQDNDAAQQNPRPEPKTLADPPKPPGQPAVKGKKPLGDPVTQSLADALVRALENPRGVGKEDAAGKSGGEAGFTADTVFVRGLPLDTNATELRLRLERFGPIKACRCAPHV